MIEISELNYSNYSN